MRYEIDRLVNVRLISCLTVCSVLTLVGGCSSNGEEQVEDADAEQAMAEPTEEGEQVDQVEEVVEEPEAEPEPEPEPEPEAEPAPVFDVFEIEIEPLNPWDALFDGLPVGTVELESGLVISEMRLGSGDLCLPRSTIVVNYVGQTEDGTVFDETTDQTGPRTFLLMNLIKGWSEGLTGMRAGGARRLTIPAELGYADKGVPDAGIRPGATLVFEVELIQVK